MLFSMLIQITYMYIYGQIAFQIVSTWKFSDPGSSINVVTYPNLPKTKPLSIEKLSTIKLIFVTTCCPTHTK